MKFFMIKVVEIYQQKKAATLTHFNYFESVYMIIRVHLKLTARLISNEKPFEYTHVFEICTFFD